MCKDENQTIFRVYCINWRKNMLGTETNLRSLINKIVNCGGAD